MQFDRHPSSSCDKAVKDCGNSMKLSRVQPSNAFFYTKLISDPPISYAVNPTDKRLEHPANIPSEMYHIFDGSTMLDNDVQLRKTYGRT